MTDAELLALLRGRIAGVKARIAAAAERAGRDPAGVRLVAVTKTVSARVAGLLPSLNVVDLGENRPQALWAKAETLKIVRWHLIGHLQRNKLDRTVPLVSLTHSADSPRLLDALSAFGVARGGPVAVLLQFNCSGEAQKGGFAPDDLPAVAEQVRSLPGLDVQGLMTMAAYGDEPEASRPAFALLRKLRDELRERTGRPLPELSMGMSGDFEVAVEEGATLVRVGSTLFDGLAVE